MDRKKQNEKENDSGAIGRLERASGARRTPIRGWKNNRPEFGIRLIEFEGHRKKFGRSIIYANDPAALLYFVLRVQQTHGLANEHVQFHLQQPAMGINDQRQRFFLAWLVLHVFRDHRDPHLQHHALAPPPVYRIVDRSQSLSQEEVREIRRLLNKPVMESLGF